MASEFSPTRKRKASTSPPREIEGTTPENAPDALETLLAVPLEIIFRRIPGPLLTRAEARCLLRIRMLANELDQFVLVSKEALQQRIGGRQFGQKLLHASHPFLRPLVPLLSVQGSLLTNSTLQCVEEELLRVSLELRECRRSLQQFSEHNWTLAESLLETLDADAPGCVLAIEKRRLADLEQEVCTRIDSLVAPSPTMEDATSEEGEGEEDGTEHTGGALEINETSLADFCVQLWNRNYNESQSQDDAMETTTSNNMDTTSDNMDTSNNNGNETSPKEGLFSYPETIQGLDQQQQLQQSDNTPMTMGAVDDQSKPIPRYSAEDEHEEEEDDDETVCNKKDEVRKEDNSQKSTRSVVSDHSDIPFYKKKEMPTQSQVQNAGEALALLATFQG